MRWMIDGVNNDKSWDEVEFQTFYNQIKRRIQNLEPEASFTALTKQQLDDIIMCAATDPIMQTFIHGFNFIDLPKTSQYIVTESGVMYWKGGPNPVFTTIEPHECTKDDFFRKNYPDEDFPTYYEQSCRPWFSLQREN